jgi:hypothetical protein
MASTIRIKRSSVAGKKPTTSDISTGELALNTKDFKLFSSNGTAIFELANALALGNTNAYIATRAPTASPTFTGTLTAPLISVSQSLSNEGGQIELALPSSGSTLSGPVAIDIYQNKLRIFETSGTNRGAYIDLSAASATVGSNLLAGGGSSSNGFSGILVGANVIVADSTTDRLTLTAGNRINLAGNPTTDTITISASTNDYLQVANAATIYQTKAVERAALANTNASIATQAGRITLVNTNLTGTNTALRTLINARLQVSNATTLLAAKASWVGLTGTNTALRTLISDRLQVANASTIYQTKAVERAALANTNASIATQATRVTLVNTNLTGTNTALRTLINARLQVSNATTLLAAKASWAGLTSTNTALRTLISDRLQVANAATVYQTKAVERAALANTNASIATQATRVTLVNTNLTGTNTALRTLINARLQVANAATLYATKSNPTTSGLLAHTGRATISTNLAVTGNTTIAGLVANGSLGTANRVLKTNGSTVFWGEASAAGNPVVLTKKNVSALLETDQVVTNVTATAYSNTVVDNSLLALYAPVNNPTFTGTIDVSQANIRNQTLTDGATISWNTTLGTVATVTLGGNRTISNPTNLKVGTYILIIKQDGVGGRSLTWGTAYKFPAGVKPDLTTTANAIDIVSFYSDGTNMFGTYAPNMS